MDIHVKINGRPATWNVQPGAILLDVLRERGYCSVKRGCGEGDCGACTVLVDGHSMRACLLLVGQVEGRSLITAEGLGSLDHPHPLQQAFVDSGAVQCGFCTPGMLLSAKGLLDEVPAPTRAQVVEALDGNLCRCTGYKKIVEAVELAAQRLRS
jgi:carbon-monoxide dehydrogenase small subunit